MLRLQGVRALWIGVVALAGIGMAAATLRMLEVSDNVAMYQGRTEGISPRERQILDRLRGIYFKPDSASYNDAAADMVAFSKRYNAHPVLSRLHLAPSLLFVLLAPFQFSKRIRARHIRIHRWSGRTLLLLTLPIAASAVYFGVVNPVAGTQEAVGISLFTTLFLLSAARGYVAIRNGEISEHREWMIRLLSMALSISVMRVVSAVFAMATLLRPLVLFVPSVWTGWIISLGVAEWWIYHTRRKTASKSLTAPQTA